MRHHLDHPIATELSYLTLQARRLRGELGPCELDSVNRRLYPIPSAIVQREAFMADRESIPDSFQGERTIPTWHFHGGKG